MLRYRPQTRLPQRALTGIKVNHLAPSVSELELRSMFSQFGTIASIRMGHGSNESYAYINYYSLTQARRATEAMNGKVISGMSIKVIVQGESSACASEQYTVKVTNLSKDVTEGTLEDLFSFSGDSEFKSPLKINPGQSFNYAYINYKTYEDAARAERELSGRKVGRSIITVKIHSSGGSTVTSPPPQPWQQSTTPISTRALPPHFHLHPQAAANVHPRWQSHIPPRFQQQVHLISPRSPQMHFTYPPHFPQHSATAPYFFPPPSQLPIPPTLGHRLPMTPWHPQSTQRLQMQSQVPRRLHSPSPCSSTVKVSLHGEISVEDLQEVFSQFGRINEKPIIRHGAPNYSYINFQSAKEAQDACELDNTQIKGVRVQVKVSVKQGGAGVSNQEAKEIPCDPLIAKLLTSSTYQDQLQKLESQQVTVKRMKNGNGVKLWGEPSRLVGAEPSINLMLEKIEKEVACETLTLPALYVPLFSSQETLSQIEEKHLVEITVTDRSQQAGVITMATLGNIVSQHFSKSDDKDDIPRVSGLSQYLSTQSTPSATEYQWLWEDDDGSYKLYESELCSTLNKQFAASPKGSFQCDISTGMGTAKYEISFAAMTQLNLSSCKTRNIRCQSSSPIWLHENENKAFVPYTSSNSTEIERMYQAGKPETLTVNEEKYTFDFDAMIQTNIETGCTYQIKRQVETESTQYQIHFQVRGLEEKTKLAIADLKDELNGALVTTQCPLPSTSDDVLCTRLIKIASQYFVSAHIAGNQVEIKGSRLQGYTERVMLLVREEILQHERKVVLSKRSASVASASSSEFPDYWEPQTEKIELKPVSPGSTEWDRVQTRMQQTLPSALIIKLQRIQNQWLWKKYSFSEQRMSEKNGGVVNEKELFHGTRNTPPEKIFKSEHGFDFRFSRPGMWGEGAYFAVNASYSNSYAYPSVGSKQLILAKVLTGETCRCVEDKLLKKPPVKRSHTHSSQNRKMSFFTSNIHTPMEPAVKKPKLSYDNAQESVFEDERYDSVCGHTNGSNIFVIYDHEKAYPAYLITYKM